MRNSSCFVKYIEQHAHKHKQKRRMLHVCVRVRACCAFNKEHSFRHCGLHRVFSCKSILIFYDWFGWSDDLFCLYFRHWKFTFTIGCAFDWKKKSTSQRRKHYLRCIVNSHQTINGAFRVAILNGHPYIHIYWLCVWLLCCAVAASAQWPENSE